VGALSGLLIALALLLAPPARAAAEPSADQLADVADRAAIAWLSRQVPEGGFRDPARHGVVDDYGTALIGAGLLRAAQRRGGDARLERAGVRAVDAMTRIPRDRWGVFQLYALEAAHELRPLARWGALLRTAGEPYVAPNLVPCARNRHCFHNHEVVGQIARGLPFEPPPRTRASTSWFDGDLQIVSDSGNFPLAYHPLSAALIAEKGGQADLLQRAASALAAAMAPDGDISYMGRGQQDAWTLAASIYAATAAAAAAGETNDGSRARRLSAVATAAFARLERLHIGPRGAINGVPRSRDLTRGPGGLNTYDSAVNSSGLTIELLDRAAGVARRSPLPAPGALPAERDGWFLDPDATDLATVRHGDVWFAVHGRPYQFFPTLYAGHANPARPADPRYDVGLLALKWRDRAGVWHDLVRPRPIGPRAPLSAGPVIRSGPYSFLPFGRRLRVSQGGAITVSGEWRTLRGRRLRGGLEVRFAPLSDGVRVTFAVRRGDRVSVATFLPEATARLRGDRATDAVSESSVSGAEPAIHLEEGFASCCDDASVAFVAEFTASRDGQVGYTVRARHVSAPPPVASRASGPSWPVVAVVALAAAAFAAIRRRRATRAP
jgi:hypothetical protein